MRSALGMLCVALAIIVITATTALAQSPNKQFSAQHTYFIAPAGSCSDSNSGTSPSRPWCQDVLSNGTTTFVCGDIVVAAGGEYGPLAISNVPSACPSTTKGIDGSGGIFTVSILCSGNLGSCTSTGTSNSGNIVEVTSSNWAVEGWWVTSQIIGMYGMRGYVADAGATGTTRLGYIAFVNDLAVQTQQGYSINESAHNHDVPGNGVDEWAVVGSIAQNSNADPICLAAIDDVAPANYDSLSGTHVFLSGNFAFNNQNPSCAGMDGEGIMLDTWDAHGYSGTGVVENNITYYNAANGLEVTMQSFNSSSPIIDVTQNTHYDDIVCPSFDVSASGDMNFQLDGGYPWTINVYRNIAQTPNASAGCGRGGFLYAMLTGGMNGPSGITMNVGGAGLQNIFSGAAGVCAGETCDSGDNVVAFNGFGIGVNTYEGPGFANTGDLLANHLGAPSCSSYNNTVACMGWNYTTQTAASDSVIGDLTPTSSGTSGHGYQPPATCVSADSLYPTWLKGIIYLSWHPAIGAATENSGLITKPCSM